MFSFRKIDNPDLIYQAKTVSHSHFLWEFPLEFVFFDLDLVCKFIPIRGISEILGLKFEKKKFWNDFYDFLFTDNFQEKEHKGVALDIYRFELTLSKKTQ